VAQWVVRYSLAMAHEIPTEPGVGELKSHLSEYLNRVIYRGELVWVRKNGRRVAAVISAETAEWLEANADAVLEQVRLHHHDDS
jgi:prevent-host-death family protein